MKINNKVKDIIETVKEETIPLTAELLLDGVVGSVVPGVVNAVLAYKQKRQERMYNIWLENIEKRVIEIEELLSIIYLDKDEYNNNLNIYKNLCIDYYKNKSIKEKLERLGLLISKRDKMENDLYKNI